MQAIITALIVLLCTAVPSFCEIVVHTKDGREIQVAVDASNISRIEFLTTTAKLGPVGAWNSNNASTWTVTATREGGYFAKETGLGNASGPAYFTERGTFRIDYSWNGGKGFYEVRFAPDFLSAKGFADGPGNTVNWTRIKP